jgi:hypothetical protein
MSELELTRFVAFMVMIAIFYTPLHESGHYATAKLVGFEVEEFELYPNPHVTAVNPDETNKLGTALFLIGGSLFIPIATLSYYLIMGNIYSLELIYLTFITVFGSHTDLTNLLKLFF